MVYVSNKGKTEHVTTLIRNKISHYDFTVECKEKPCVMYILVEAMGHINYGKRQRNDRKGIISLVDKEFYEDVVQWNTTKVPINSKILEW